MPTQKPRLNVTLEKPIAKILFSLAEEEHKSISSLLSELIIEALERREDLALSSIAEARDSGKVKTVSHDDAWK